MQVPAGKQPRNRVIAGVDGRLLRDVAREAVFGHGAEQTVLVAEQAGRSSALARRRPRRRHRRPHPVPCPPVGYGDYGVPPAFQDADQLLLMSSSDPNAEAVSLHRTAVAAAAVTSWN